MKYYTETDLIEISIYQFSKELRANNSINYSEELVENDEHFVFYNADIFRQGVCQLFAYALHKRFRYEVYKIQVEKGFHVFCKTLDNKYIDVRGITSSFDDFVKGTGLSYLTNDTSTVYTFVEEDFNGCYYEIALAFANLLIERDIKRYQV